MQDQATATSVATTAANALFNASTPDAFVDLSSSTPTNEFPTIPLGKEGAEHPDWRTEATRAEALEKERDAESPWKEGRGRDKENLSNGGAGASRGRVNLPTPPAKSHSAYQYSQLVPLKETMKEAPGIFIHPMDAFVSVAIRYLSVKYRTGLLEHHQLQQTKPLDQPVTWETCNWSTLPSCTR